MRRILPALFAFAVVSSAPAARGSDATPESPAEMAAATERWMVEGAGARFPDGMADPASDGDFVFVDGSWPLPFRERVGEAVALRISPDTGCYEFADPDGTVFWTVVPVAPLTWNWISPFRSPLRPDTQDLYSPFRLAREWLLLSPAEFDSRAESAENAEHLVTRHSSLVTRGAAGPATNLCFTAFSYTETNLFFTAAWPTNETLPESVLDLYGSTNLLDPCWTFLFSHPATTNPVSFAVAPATLPWYVEPTQHVHDATCAVATNVVLSPLDGVTVYTNAFWSCATNRTPVPPGLFRLGTRHDTDGDGLFDSFEKLAAGTDPLDPDTDGDGVPDGLTWAQWRSHPLWAENGDGTNLVVFLYEPVANGFAALRFDDLCIPLSSNAGPWCLCVPTNAVVDCTLVSGAHTVAMLWYGPPEAVEWTPANQPPPGPRWTWDVPDAVEVPIWCDRPMSVFGGNVGGGFCRFARPELRIRSEEPGQEGCLDVCVHWSDGVARFSWSVEPSACTGLWAFATGHLSDSGDGRSFCIDVSNAVPGLAGTRAGTLSVGSLQSPFFGDDSLFGTLSGPVSAHRCAGLSDPSFGFCLSCGAAHGDPPDACHHEPWCATKTNLLADCDCAEPFVRIGNAGILRLVGEDRPCCSVHDGFSSFADVLSAPGALHAGVSNGVFLAVEPESRSPTIGGFVARYRIYDGDGGTYRDLSVPFTCADLGIDPLLGNAPVPSDWQEDPEAYYVTNGTLFVARCPSPYPIRLWNESPSDARLVFSFSSPTNGPALRETPSGIAHCALSITNTFPFSALNSDETVYLDASCSNVLATLTLTLSDPAANRTFLAESLSVQAVDTDVGEHWRVRSATDRLSWDFSDAPEPVWICLRYPQQHGEMLGQMVGNPVVSKTPSFSLDLPPGDYMIEAYFPRVYAGERSEWEVTNTLHVVHTEIAETRHERLVGAETRARFSLTADSTQIADWRISPVVAGGPTLHRTALSNDGHPDFLSGATSVWVKAGSVPGVYTVAATHPNCSASTTNVQFVVARVTPESFRFNWDQSSSATDGINLRGGPKPADAFDLTVGEWVRGGQNLPACYVTNMTPVVEARFTVEPDAVTNCGLRATGGPFGGIAATNIAFSGGDSGVVRLSMSGTTGSLVGRYGYALVWMCGKLDADSFPEEGFDETTNLVAYTIFREPLSPWTNEWTNVQNAWTNALEFALATAGASGSDSETNALAAITQHLFAGHGLVYDTTNGISSYTTKSAGFFNISGYLNKSAVSDIYGTARNGNIVNCYDQAAAVTCFGRILGVNVQYRLQEPFGCLNPLHVVGPIFTNNPFFDLTGTPPLVGLDEHRIGFRNHAFATLDEKVFDACAGPSKGIQLIAEYLSGTIDRSTNWEARVAAPLTAIPMTNTLHTVF